MNFDECYLCKKPDGEVGSPEEEWHSMCQDCGTLYCEACFHTPCHDLCRSTDKRFHYSDVRCPHWSPNR